GQTSAARTDLVTLHRSRNRHIHTPADRINADGKLWNAEMKKLYDAGFAAGVQAGEDSHYGSADFVDANGMPAWNEIARFCQRKDAQLRNEKERRVVNNIAAPNLFFAPQPQQRKKLRM